MSLRRGLYLTHRWLGISVGLLVLTWFVSGVVMMYVGYPHLTDAERRASTTPLEAAQVKVGVDVAWRKTATQGAPDSVRLANIATAAGVRPAYRFQQAGKLFVVWADDGRLRDSVSIDDAKASAQALRAGKTVAVDSIEYDQWSVAGLDAHRPLYRVELDDADGSIFYVSSHTGEVVRDTTRYERAWNWVGSVVHWVYFTPLRALREPWRQVVMWTSAIAFSLALSGAITGWLRLRWRKRYSHGRITPYRGWQRWHHLLGLGAALFALTWLFSGWLSVNPFQLFERGGITRDDRLAVAGGVLDDAILSTSAAAALAKQSAPIAEIEWLRFAGQGYLRLYARDGNTSTLLSARDLAPTTLSPEQLRTAASQLRVGLPIAGTTWLPDGDHYYYQHHDEKPLPVLRVDFADADATSFYLDPVDGRIAGYADDNSRLYRWLFNGLHQFDFPFLIRHRPAWDIVVIVLLVLGASLSLSGLVIGWRRLRKTLS